MRTVAHHGPAARRAAVRAVLLTALLTGCGIGPERDPTPLSPPQPTPSGPPQGLPDPGAPGRAAHRGPLPPPDQLTGAPGAPRPAAAG